MKMKSHCELYRCRLPTCARPPPLPPHHNPRGIVDGAMSFDYGAMVFPRSNGRHFLLWLPTMPSLRSISPTMSRVSSGGVRGHILLRSSVVSLRSSPVGMAAMCSGGTFFFPMCRARLDGLLSGSCGAHAYMLWYQSTYECRVWESYSMRLALLTCAAFWIGWPGHV